MIKDNNRTEIRLAGCGGQGLISASVFLAQAALWNGFQVAQTQFYGPEIRGGVCIADVVVDKQPIEYPRVEIPDILLILSAGAWKMAENGICSGNILIIDSSLEENEILKVNAARVCQKILWVPLIESAMTFYNKKIMVNMLSLGMINRYLGLLDLNSLIKAVAHYLPQYPPELFSEALTVGTEMAARLLEKG